MLPNWASQVPVLMVAPGGRLSPVTCCRLVILHFRCPCLCLQVGVNVPLIVRLEGTNVERGKEILRTSGMALITADDLDDAAIKAVQSIA